MKLIVSVIKWLWWLGLSYIPIALHTLERQFMDSIACPPAGDCYVPGSEILLDFDIFVIGLAVYLWPICIWLLGGRYVLGGILSLVQVASRSLVKVLKVIGGNWFSPRRPQ